MKLSEVKTGEKVSILSLTGQSSLQHRLTEMGFVAGREITVIKNAPLADPIEYRLMDYEISLRRSEAQNILVTREPVEFLLGDSEASSKTPQTIEMEAPGDRKKILVGLVGNPNCGKTSLFNHLSGLNEHTGNYSGVTVESKHARVDFEGYTIEFVDLPGTYSIADFSPEEKLVTEFIERHKPDLIVNVLDSTNLERNLYLTTQLIDMNQRVILALNMWDEFLKSGDKLDQKLLSKLLGMPTVNIIARRGRGIAQLLDTIVKAHTQNITFESKQIHYPQIIETQLSQKCAQENNQNNSRYKAILEIEDDNKLQEQCQREFKSSVRTTIATARYGFVRGALKESYQRARRSFNTPSSKIDKFLTNRFLGLPIFVGMLWLVFWATFTLGSFPMDWIDAGVGALSQWANGAISTPWLNDLVVDGVIGGVGGVIIFLPNILILFLFISIMEDTGYMARAAFITDKLMHSIGLHGKSFIPLIMGFGCNVPAIMATRTIENRGNRLQTMLMVPFMSCSARLPVYILIVGAFFPGNEANMLFAIYFMGVLMGILTSIILKKIAFKKATAHFVMELPPYRIPTLWSIFKNMWNKGSQYLRKMGGIILVAAILIWALGYFPQGTQANGEPKQSYLESVGRAIEPTIAPLGFDWQIGVSLVTGVAAKEIVVSSMSVIYDAQDEGDDTAKLSEILQKDKSWNTAVALSFLTFVLIYFPCMASIAAIRREAGAWKWALFTIFYTTGLAWVASFAVYRIALLFI